MSMRRVEQLEVSYTGSDNQHVQHLQHVLPVPITVASSRMQSPLAVETIDRIKPLASVVRSYLHDPARTVTDRQMIEEIAGDTWFWAYDALLTSGDESLPSYPLAFARMVPLQSPGSGGLYKMLHRRGTGVVFNEFGVTSGRDVRIQEGWLDQSDPLRHLGGSAAMLELAIRPLRREEQVCIKGRWGSGEGDRRTGFFFEMCGFKKCDFSDAPAPEGGEERAEDGSTYLAAPASEIRKKLAENFTFTLPRRLPYLDT